MKKIRIRVNGRVQGVGFRYLTKILADELGIFGFAMNEEDGSVTIEAMTDSEENLEKFIEKVKASPSPVGRVHSFSLVEDSSIQEENRFFIR